MSDSLSFKVPQVEVAQASDGSLLFSNPIPLAPYPANIGAWLRTYAEKTPGKRFMAQRDRHGNWQSISYQETLRRVNRLSNGLLAQRIHADRPIAILSENCIDMAILHLVAMQIGIAVVPISYAYSVRSQTGTHIKHILDVTGTHMVVMSHPELHMPKLLQWDTRHLHLYSFSSAECSEEVPPLEQLLGASDTLSDEGEHRFAAVTPQTLAKIQFTSGSTNLPKGVEVTHEMMISNQVGIAQMWPFLGQDEIFVDWLPWNHTFGGNFVYNMVLMHGGTLYIDHGNPTPQGIEVTIKNIIDIQPTIYFGVPRSYTLLYNRMQADQQLQEALFKRLKFIFTAAAALDQVTFDGMKSISRAVRGRAVPFLSGWGCTETAPDATLVSWEIKDARGIGLPIPGVHVKLAPDPSGKMELRIKGPNITRGYYNNPQASSVAFDSEGYYCTGDAGVLLVHDVPAAGLMFNGRIGEDFKLSTGTWAHNARLRASLQQLGHPFIVEVVVAAPNHDYLTALVFPDLAALRTALPETSQQLPDDRAFLHSDRVRRLFSDIFAKHNAENQGSSERFERFVLLETPPRIDQNETTDKGYINQSAVLAQRADIVAKLYQPVPPDEVVVLQ